MLLNASCETSDIQHTVTASVRSTKHKLIAFLTEVENDAPNHADTGNMSLSRAAGMTESALRSVLHSTLSAAS
jgi:hypothetical protein